MLLVELSQLSDVIGDGRSQKIITVENNISTHTVVGYPIDTIFIFTVIIIIIVWR